ncbi:hypothetical protein QSV34_10535 [Porticoccus sp. W117]|uniref:hypothetical protein n=1 Tax=Porticoccus sp. W117 TaxID=3054777 RepID=UPI00259AA2DA|nr:hypothetical protein [Porticoccus sp. W117]MDM3871787.1 hypothetical protein [Porticoccus sp. W117]
MSSHSPPSTPGMAGSFNEAARPDSSNEIKPDRIFTKTVRKRSSYEGVGKSEVTNTQERAHDLQRKISRYYKTHEKNLVDREYHRLTSSTLQTHLRYGPPHSGRSLEKHYRSQAKRNIHQERDKRLNQVKRISLSMQGQVVEKSQVMRKREIIKQEQKHSLVTAFKQSI